MEARTKDKRGQKGSKIALPLSSKSITSFKCFYSFLYCYMYIMLVRKRKKNKGSHISLLLCKRKDDMKKPKLHDIYKIADHFRYTVATKIIKCINQVISEKTSNVLCAQNNLISPPLLIIVGHFYI